MDTSIWSTLSAINCNEHIEKKGKFSYLAWTWAWAMVKERYPLSHYMLLDDIVYPDQTMEVRVEVTVQESSDFSLSHVMWLPVLDFKNNAIPNPNAFDVNTSRMRCLVKCLAMFGLGHYIYAGESLPQEPVITFTEDQKKQYIKLMAEGDSWGMKQFFDTVGNEVMSALFNAAPKGEITKQKDIARGLIVAANGELKTTLAALDEAISAALYETIEEIVAELSTIEQEYVNNALSEVQKKQIEQLRETHV